MTFWEWCTATRWRTWVCHGIVALLMGLVIHPTAGPTLYVWKEIQEWRAVLLYHLKRDPVDHVMDALVPVVVGAVLLSLGVGTFWVFDTLAH